MIALLEYLALFNYCTFILVLFQYIIQTILVRHCKQHAQPIIPTNQPIILPNSFQYLLFQKIIPA